MQGSGHRLAFQNSGLIQRKSLIKGWDVYYDGTNVYKYGLYSQRESLLG